MRPWRLIRAEWSPASNKLKIVEKKKKNNPLLISPVIRSSGCARTENKIAMIMRAASDRNGTVINDVAFGSSRVSSFSYPLAATPTPLPPPSEARHVKTVKKRRMSKMNKPLNCAYTRRHVHSFGRFQCAFQKGFLLPQT